MTPLLTAALAGAAGCLLAAAALRPVRRTIPYLGGMTLAAVTAGATLAGTGAASARRTGGCARFCWPPRRWRCSA